MDTICLNCVFADWEGNRQVQCDFDRLEKFTEQGVEIVEEQEEQSGKSYFRIMGRICNCCRHESTLDGIPARQWKERVRSEITTRVALAVYVDDGYDNYTAPVWNSLDSCLLQTVKPFEIILIYNRRGVEPFPFDPTSHYLEYFSDIKIPWRIENIQGVPSVTGELEIADYYSSVDIAIKSKEMKAVYFASCKAGYQFPERYIETIDDAINENLDRFVAILPDEDGNGLFVQRGLHNLLNGNKKMHGCENIIEKIEAIAREEGTSHMVKRFEDLIK